MAASADQLAHRTSAAHREDWPVVIAWLAVIAHVCMALAIWSIPKPPSNVLDDSVIHAAIVLLAQANLLIVWLVVGDSLWLRRIAWTACGLSGILLLLATSTRLQETPAVAIAEIDCIMTGVLLAFVRLCGFRATRCRHTYAVDSYKPANGRQFSLLELFGASLDLAIAAAMLVHVNFVEPFSPWNAEDKLTVLLYFFLPLGLSTLVSVVGLARPTWLAWQVILSGATMVLSLALVTDPAIEWAGMFLIAGSHWFLVAATLWIFQMCGYRLVRSQAAAMDEAG